MQWTIRAKLGALVTGMTVILLISAITGISQLGQSNARLLPTIELDAHQAEEAAEMRAHLLALMRHEKSALLVATLDEKQRYIALADAERRAFEEKRAAIERTADGAKSRSSPS